VAAPTSARRTAREEREERSYKKPSSNTPLILSLVLLVVCAGAGGLWYMVNQNEPEPEPAAPVVMATPPAPAAPLPAAAGSTESAPPPVQQPAAAPPKPVDEPVAAEPVKDNPAPPPAAAAQDPNYVFVVPEPGKPIAVPRGNVDPARITLEKVPPLQRWSKTSDTTWSSVQADLALYLQNSGARSNRAGDALVKAGRDAYPAMVMAMMTQDYTTLDGVKMAGSLNDLIGKIVGGEHFGWRAADRYEIGSDEWTEAVLVQKKVAIQRYNRWVDKLREGDSEWEIIAKKGGASGNRKDEDGVESGELPPDVPPDIPPPDGR
jgi:hypothetical protein